MSGPLDGSVGAASPTGQSYRERLPVPELSGFVSSVWVQQVVPGAVPYAHRSIPNGSVEFRCPVGSVPQIVGPATAARVEVLEPGTTVVGVRFHPGAAVDALAVPVSELADEVLDADEVWGRSAVWAGERIAESGSADAAAAILQDFAVGRRGGALVRDQLVAEAVRRLMPRQAATVSSLWSSLCVSERQLRRLCRSRIGVGPKALQRMLRFQGFLARVQFALAQGNKPTENGLAPLAAELGYADQAHLTRECVRLTGVTPRAFLRETERDCGGGHDHAVSFAPLLEPAGGTRSVPIRAS